MFKIAYNHVYVTRGDTGFIPVFIKVPGCCESYSMKFGDQLTFSIRKVVDSPILLQKVLYSNLVVLNPEDTKDLELGDYIYDIELTTADGNVYTILCSKFTVTSEVS